MKFTAITSKTGITAIISLLATGLGMYTGTIPIVAGGQTIITALLALFLRDAVAKNATAIETVKSEQAQTTSTVLEVGRATMAVANDTRRAVADQRSDGGAA